MRLIDADIIKKQFDPNTWQGEMMITITDNLETTFDVDKIIEQIKHECINLMDKKYQEDEYHMFSKGVQAMYLKFEKIMKNYKSDTSQKA